MTRLDAAIVGSGPNGLAAAITLARAGLRVIVLEGAGEVGGATRSAELTLPGYVHDLGSAIHPLAVASPFMATIDWAGHGLEWVMPPASVAHPLDDDAAVIGWRDFDRTVQGLGADGPAYRAFFGPAVERFDALTTLVMQPPPGLLKASVKHPSQALRFGPMLGLPATLAARRFSTVAGRALFGGHAAHAVAPFSKPFTAGFGVLLAAASHAVGWPFPAGGAAEISRVLAETLVGLGGEIVLDHPVSSIGDLPEARSVLFALTPHQIASVLGEDAPASVADRLANFAYGPGVCKVDYLTEGPIPWADSNVHAAATVHLGGRFEEIADAEAEVGAGRYAERPFVLLAQPSGFDPTRSPDSADDDTEPFHTIWAYCHVPNGSTRDMSDRIEAQIERFAPGFRSRIRHRHVTTAMGMEQWNPNLVGGDIAGGSTAGLQAVFRPWPSPHPNHLYGRYFIGSASSSPGGGVHGMGGVAGAAAVLRAGG